jgi:hypothetical protein
VTQVVLVDGPEKTGKTRLIALLQNRMQHSGKYGEVTVRHWGPVSPDDRVYSTPLRKLLDDGKPGLEIWDRAWPAEYVYGNLLARQRRGSTDPWLLEWLHGRALVNRGARIIMLPKDRVRNAKLRDDTDLVVDLQREYRLYEDYGAMFQYTVGYNDYSLDFMRALLDNVEKQINGNAPVFAPAQCVTVPENFEANPRFTLVIGEERNPNDYKTMPGAWLPFTSAKMTQFVRKYFGMKAFNVGWTNSEDIDNNCVPLSIVHAAKTVICFGMRARATAKRLGCENVAAFSHPGFFSRWNTDRGRKALAEFQGGFADVYNNL